MKNKVIRFGDGLPTLLDYGKRSWNLNEKYIIEFYPNFTTSVLLISAENSLLQTHLDEISNNTEPISLDLEWEEEICLFQFCTSKGCLIIRHSRGPGNSVLRSFLENHSFYGKGNYNDLQKLTEKFGDDFKIDLEDIERTRLIPNGYSTNFIKMSEQFAGKSTAVFKDKEMTFSNWESETLSMRQVMYAAFDVVALFKCYSNFPPCTENLKPIKIKKKGPKGKKCINIDSAFRRKYPIVSPNKIDISKPLFCYILKNYTENPNIYEIKNKICKLSNNINEEEEENDLFDDDYLVDYISVFKNDDNSIDILVSLFVEINKNNLSSDFLSCEKVIVVPEIDQFTVELLTKDDVFYLNEIQENLMNNNSLNDFLSIFGTDFSFIFFENYKYASVKPNDPYAALRLIKFLPFVSKIQLHEFPSFLPVLSVYSQSNSDIKNQINLTEEQQQRIEIKNVQNNKYIFTFSSNDEKEQFLENFIKNNTFENQLMIFPFTSDEHINIMQSYKIILKNCQLSIPSIYDKFNKIGQLFSIHKNEILNIIYIQFRAKSDAYRALMHMKELSNNIEILKGTKVTLRNLPENITEREIIDSCKNAYEILELNLNDKKFMKLIFKNQLQAEEFCEELKAKEIRGKQIQAELVYPQKEETPYWKMQQISKWVKIKINKELNEIFMKANEFGKIIDIKMKDEFIYIMFNNEESAEEMKKANNECEDIDQQIFTLFLNKKLLMNEIKDNNPNEPSYVNRKVFILDPKPELLTDELLAEKAFNWRHLISGAHNIDSIAHAGKKRTIFYSGGKKRDQQIINLIINLGVELGDENKWKPVTMTFSKATKLLDVPPPPVKKPRRWVIIDPAPKSMTEDVIRNICTGEEPFDVMFQNSSIQKGEKRAVILKEPHARNIFWKIKEMEYDGKKLNVTKIPPENAPPPLE